MTTTALLATFALAADSLPSGNTMQLRHEQQLAQQAPFGVRQPVRTMADVGGAKQIPQGLISPPADAFFTNFGAKLMRLIPIAAIFVALPIAAHAVGTESPVPPKPTQTASDCKAGEIFDEKTKTCLDAKSEIFDDDIRYSAVRELAYDGQYDRALLVLNTMPAGESRVLTYRGFIARKTGNLEAAQNYYEAALEIDADNLLARSYMGQALVKQGDIAGARAQLREIRTRGGRNTWAEYALRTALETGHSFSY